MSRDFSPTASVDAVAHGIAGRGDIDIVDAQVHLAPNPSLGAMGSALDALGIASVVFDELWGRNEHGHGTPCVELGEGAYRPFSPLAQAAALQEPGRFSYLQRVTRRDPDLVKTIAGQSRHLGCRALRVVIHEHTERELFVGGGYDEMLSCAQQAGLPLMMLGRDSGTVLATAADRFPRLTFIVDHCGWVKTAAQWDDVLGLGRFPNVCMKWSHAFRAFSRTERADADVQRAFERALGAFGPERLLWASDITHEESVLSWAQLLAFVLGNPALQDVGREAVLAGTARRLFNWPVVNQMSLE